ncbi:hypothetical protein HK096_001725, partial [Nowakowskiella sp. JEL0078]
MASVLGIAALLLVRGGLLIGKSGVALSEWLGNRMELSSPCKRSPLLIPIFKVLSTHFLQSLFFVALDLFAAMFLFRIALYCRRQSLFEREKYRQRGLSNSQKEKLFDVGGFTKNTQTIVPKETLPYEPNLESRDFAAIEKIEERTPLISDPDLKLIDTRKGDGIETKKLITAVDLLISDIASNESEHSEVKFTQELKEFDVEEVISKLKESNMEENFSKPIVSDEPIADDEESEEVIDDNFEESMEDFSKSQTRTLFRDDLKPLDVMLLFFANPYGIASCVAKSLSGINTLAILAGNLFASMFWLALASHFSLYPVVLILPFTQLVAKDMGSKTLLLLPKMIFYFLLNSGFLLGLCYWITGNWDFIESTYGVILTVPDLTPNIGFHWYFFIE